MNKIEFYKEGEHHDIITAHDYQKEADNKALILTQQIRITELETELKDAQDTIDEAGKLVDKALYKKKEGEDSE